MRPSKPVFAISIAASASFLVARQLVAGDWPVILEVSSIVLLAVLGIRVSRLLGGALVLSAIGDFFLGVRRIGSVDGQSLFLLGLGSFLIAHLLYIAMFRRYRFIDWRKIGPARVSSLLAILLALGKVLAILWASLGSLKIPVVLYALVLCGMVISAVLADLGSPLAVIGALFFIASDSMLAVSRFRAPFLGSTQLIWVTYYLAQVFILRGFGQRRETE
jgi:uncharacterized membrane protein YhhN